MTYGKGWPRANNGQRYPLPCSILLAPKKKTDNDVEIVKIVDVSKKILTIAILMHKDVPNPGKLVLGPYN